jgi:hypothetical protein
VGRFLGWAAGSDRASSQRPTVKILFRGIDFLAANATEERAAGISGDKGCLIKGRLFSTHRQSH